MIRIDTDNRIVYLCMNSNVTLGVSLRNYKFYEITGITDAIRNNEIKVLYKNKWDYVLNHYGKS